MAKVWRRDIEIGPMYLGVKLSPALWWFSLANGLRAVHLLRFGWVEKPGVPGVRIYQATVLWLSVQVGF